MTFCAMCFGVIRWIKMTIGAFESAQKITDSSLCHDVLQNHNMNIGSDNYTVLFILSLERKMFGKSKSGSQKGKRQRIARIIFVQFKKKKKKPSRHLGMQMRKLKKKCRNSQKEGDFSSCLCLVMNILCKLRNRPVEWIKTVGKQRENIATMAWSCWTIFLCCIDYTIS